MAEVTTLQEGFLLELSDDEMMLLTAVLGRASGEGFNLYNTMQDALDEADLRYEDRYEVEPWSSRVVDLLRKEGD